MTDKKPNKVTSDRSISKPQRIIKDGGSKPSANSPLKGSGKPTKRGKG